MFAIIRNTAVGAPKTLIALGVFLFLFMPLLSLSQETKYEQRYSRGNDPAAYAENSVLSSGKWIKIAVSETGVYQIGYDELAAMGFNVQSLDPRNLSLFGNGGAMLPEGNFEPRYDDLVENAVFVEGETDGVMNQGDALFFYGQEPGFWKYQNNRFIFQKNLFSDSTFYFLTVLDRPGKRVEVLAQAQGEPGRETAIFLDYRQHESDLENLIMSGKEWFGEELSKAHPSETFTFNFANREAGRPLRFEMNLAGRSITESFQFDVKANGQTIVNPIVIQQLSSGNSTHARDFTQNISFSSNADDLSFEITIDAQSDNSKAWLNYIRINSWCKLNYNPAKQLQFRNPEVVYENAVAKFLLSGNMTQARLWDVTHSLAPKSQQFEVNGEQMHFKANADSIRQYVLFEKSNTLSIGSYSSVRNQNLHAIKNADMLIVTHPDFIDEAHALASVHYNDDGLNSVVVDINEIYNEFGSGQQDLTAIRDFVRMVYAKSEG
ncbi:MAG TPA: C25 family cysteine peptidase, partial [Bacteroidales bacterium]|nr:C25 family cysteine peptidase [Bacteroidales bacterium]